MDTNRLALDENRKIAHFFPLYKYGINFFQKKFVKYLRVREIVLTFASAFRKGKH